MPSEPIFVASSSGIDDTPPKLALEPIFVASSGIGRYPHPPATTPPHPQPHPGHPHHHHNNRRLSAPLFPDRPHPTPPHPLAWLGWVGGWAAGRRWLLFCVVNIPPGNPLRFWIQCGALRCIETVLGHQSIAITNPQTRSGCQLVVSWIFETTFCARSPTGWGRLWGLGWPESVPNQRRAARSAWRGQGTPRMGPGKVVSPRARANFACLWSKLRLDISNLS